MKDYYEILGVDKTSTKKDIKKAYKSLAVKYHPDRTQGNKELEEKFKEIKKAYETLSDDKKRSEYDFMGNRSQQSGGNPYQNHGFGGFGDFGGFRSSQSHKDFQDIFGSDDIQDLFRNIKREHNQQQGKTGSVSQTITLEQAINGGEITLQDPNGKKYNITIPANTKDGTKLRFSPSKHEQVIVSLKIGLADGESINGDDVTIKRNVDVFTLMLGGEAIIEFFGKKIKAKIKECTQNGTKLRIPKQGFNDGNLFVSLNAELPTSLSDEEKELFRTLR